MNRLLILVEGPTERAVIQQVLAEYLALHGLDTQPRVVGKPGHKGGNAFDKVLPEILALLKQEPNSYVSTCFDYYGLPVDWPGRRESTDCGDLESKSNIVEEGLKSAVINALENRFNPARFIPYIQMHELETLLFSNPRVMAEIFGKPALQNQFEQIVSDCGGCEAINDNPQSAPSKRIGALFPGYRKGSSVNAHAPRIIQKTGIDTIRDRCPHFNNWINQLILIGQNH